MIKTKIFSLTLFLALLFQDNSLFSQRPQSLNLENILYLAEKNDPQLIEYKFSSKAYQAELEEAERNFYPTIENEINRSHSVTFSNPRGATIFTFSNTMELPIYNRAMIYTHKRAEKKILENRYTVLERLNTLRLEVIELYYSIITLKKVIAIREEEYLKAKESYRLSRLRLKHQRNIPIDVLLNESLLLETKLELQKAYNDYDEEKLKLRKKVNISYDFILDIDKKPLKGSYKLEHCIQNALSHRVDLKKAVIANKVNKLQYEIEKSAYYPEIQLESTYSLTSEDSYDLKDREDWSVFLTLSLAIGDEVTVEPKAGMTKDYRLDDPKDEESLTVTLFDKHTRKSDKAHARATHKGSQRQIEELKSEIIFEVTEAFNNVLESQQSLELAKLRVKLGEGLVKKAESEIKTGRKDVEDLIEAKQKYISYRIEREKSLQEYRFSIINLKWAMGSLSNLY